MTAPRRVRVRALAKLNLGLKVLYKRLDGFHELRTVFQTISLADSIDIEFTPGRRTAIELASDVEIPDNLVVRAARAILDATRTTGLIRLGLRKRIPMGGGLGGGSTDAAAVLLALPVLTGRPLALEPLHRVASELGSDVPFFLLGGTALGLGRGTELYPLPDARLGTAVVVAPQVHVATPEAYRSLQAPEAAKLTNELVFHKISSFQSRVWSLAGAAFAGERGGVPDNDFEAVVFQQFPQLKSIQAKLHKLGAKPAMLTGSGAALFGIFRSREEGRQALTKFAGERVFPVTMVGRNRYRSMWRRQLRPHLEGSAWPPQSRYVR